MDTEERGPFYPEIIGPFMPEFAVSIAGFRVPYISVQPHHDGRVSVSLDHRFGLDGPVSREEFNRWVGFLADAMAVAAGYSCHGENCTPMNPHKQRLGPLGAVAPVLGVIDGGKTEEPTRICPRCKGDRGRNCDDAQCPWFYV